MLDHDPSKLSRKSSIYRSTTQTDNSRADRQVRELNDNPGHISDNGLSSPMPNDRRRKSQLNRSRRDSVRDRKEIMSIEKAYDSNEQRMKNLERMVDELTNELKRYDNGSMLSDLQANIDG